MDRYLVKNIKADLAEKLVLVSGPRQVGKTTLSKMISEDFDYYNHDNPEDRLRLNDRAWDRQKELVIFDELHKMDNWKSWLKGIYDTESIPPWVLVTGSARLDVYRKVGDSLAGRYFPYRLHPFDVKELSENGNEPAESLDQLLACGGFPEPFLKGTESHYNRWRRTHVDIILRQDIVDFTDSRSLRKIETLIELLRSRISSPVSYASLARDVGTSDNTIKRWMDLLEEMFVIFRLYPYHRNIGRSLQKTPKYYFFDIGQVKDVGAKFENLIACALVKEIDRRRDCLGEDWSLAYLRTKDEQEVDFLLLHEGVPALMVEAKWSDQTPAAGIKHFAKFLSGVPALQLVGNLAREKTYPFGLQIRDAANWLKTMDF